MPAEMRQHVPFPFPDQRLRVELGAVVQETVLGGQLPARLVVHTDDNNWMVGDGVNDPNESGACIATHMSHVVARDGSVAALSALPLGHQAERPGLGQPWIISRFEWEPEPE